MRGNSPLTMEHTVQIKAIWCPTLYNMMLLRNVDRFKNQHLQGKTIWIREGIGQSNLEMRGLGSICETKFSDEWSLSRKGLYPDPKDTPFGLRELPCEVGCTRQWQGPLMKHPSCCLSSNFPLNWCPCHLSENELSCLVLMSTLQ